MDPITSIGRILGGQEMRDAIHVAIAPMEAAVELSPGQHVGIDGHGRISATEPHIGIVDPFLRRPVETGERCWVMLYPNTIRSIRHQWVHPAFEREPEMDELRHAAELVAQTCGKTYEALMSDATDYNYSLSREGAWGDYIMDNSERYKNVEGHLWEKFWLHFEKVTGQKANDKYKSAPYTCSC